MISLRQITSKQSYFFVSFIIFFLLTIYTVQFVQNDFQAQGYQAIQQSKTIVGSLLGEFSAIVADYLFMAADHYWHQGRWYYIPTVYGMILQIQPLFLEAWSLLGWFYAFNWAEDSSEEETKQAAEERGIRVLEKGLRYHPNRFRLYFDLAWIYYKKRGDYKQTIFYLEKAVQWEHPIYVDRLLSLSLFRVGRIEEAEAVWQVYLRKNPDNAFAKQQLARVKALRHEAVAA